MGRPQIEPVTSASAVNTVATSAAAPASTHQPSLRRRSHMAEASVVMAQPA